jgi:hypothetical protein
MKKLLLAVAMVAGLAAPAFAQSAATDPPGTYPYGPPSVEARTFTPVAPASQMTTAPDTFSANPASQQAYGSSVSDPIQWKASKPWNYGTTGG